MNSIKNKIAIFIIIFSNNAIANSNIIVSTDEPVSGISQHDYVNMWWQWAVSMSNEESPVQDRVGVKCSVNQIGPVWFLAGGYGSSKIIRKCSIPSDKHIFFPVINMLYYPKNNNENLPCEAVKKGAELNNKYLKTFKVSIDNHKFLNPVFFRNSSIKCFDLIARKANNHQHSEIYPSATDGYWVMLKPLSLGTHKLLFSAEYNRPDGAFGRMVQDIEYTIDIYKP